MASYSSQFNDWSVKYCRLLSHTGPWGLQRSRSQGLQRASRSATPQRVLGPSKATHFSPDLRPRRIQPGYAEARGVSLWSSRRCLKTCFFILCWLHTLWFISNYTLSCLVCSSPAPFSEGASTIHLPVKDCHITEGTNCTMYGWGETKSTAFFHQYAMSPFIWTIIQTKMHLYDP